ncbi:MAG: hypothetical protein K2X93_13265 [Candidatus Obscuribacterales bacterium]|nr:hypothetical protein [Candidatus Obscuribacterales bacterium]
MKSRQHTARKCTGLALAVLASLSSSLYTPITSDDSAGPQAAYARSRPPALPSDTVNLIYQLSQQPELMNLSYLRYVVGAPENERSQLALKAKNYYWYQEPKRTLLYQLHQDGPQSGSVTKSVFTINVPNSQLTTKEMERIFGQQHQKVFDHQSHPNDVYTFGPNTYVAFTQPHDTFRVNQIQVGYQGPPLPPPPQQAVYSAYNLGRNKAIEQAMKSGNWSETITWLHRDASMRPGDPMVHIQLGTAYRSGLMLNEAIAEYSHAARLGAGDPEVEKICRAALVDMKVLPPTHHNHHKGSYLAGSQPVSAAAGL